MRTGGMTSSLSRYCQPLIESPDINSHTKVRWLDYR